MNYRELFTLYSFGFDNYPAWVSHHKAMHAKHPLGCAEFGAEGLKLWEAANQQATLYVKPKGVQFRIQARGTIVEMQAEAEKCETKKATSGEQRYRAGYVKRLDGTIVKEWGAR
jgi:hypothetical protein